jgi:hypothetical protein
MLINEAPKNCIRTFTGTYVNLLNPKPETINIEDIAWGLSGIRRWNAQCHSELTVGLHSLRMAAYGGKDALELLMHDATEAYLGDIPSPLKKLLPDYQKLEHGLSVVIANKWSMAFPYPENVHIIDSIQLLEEWDYFDQSRPQPPRHTVARKFIESFNTLYAQRRNTARDTQGRLL